MYLDNGFPLELYRIGIADLVKKTRRYNSAMANMALQGWAASLDRVGLKEAGDGLRKRLFKLPSGRSVVVIPA